jgi:hypothetical protein
MFAIRSPVSLRTFGAHCLGVAVFWLALGPSADAGPLRLYSRRMTSHVSLNVDSFYGNDIIDSLKISNGSTSLRTSLRDSFGDVVDAYSAASLSALGDMSLAAGYFDKYDSVKTATLGALTDFQVIVENVSGQPLPLKLRFHLPPARLRIIDATGFKLDGSPNVNPGTPPSAEFFISIWAERTRDDVEDFAFDALWSLSAMVSGLRDNVVHSITHLGSQRAVGSPTHVVTNEAFAGVANAVTTIDFDAFTAELDMGTLSGFINDGHAALSLRYQMYVKVSGVGGVFNIGALASVGDPFEFLGDPLDSGGFRFDPAADFGTPTASVPEPATLATFLFGIPALLATRRRRRNEGSLS